MVVQKMLCWGWLGPVLLYVFVDTSDPLGHDNCLTMLWKKLKSDQKLYILK